MKTPMTEVLRSPRGEARLVRRSYVLRCDKTSLRSTGTVTVGSSQAATLSLDAPGVSRLHCRFEATDDGVVLSDLGSTNGTFVSGLQVQRVILPEAARVQIGQTVIDFELSDQFEDQELSAEPRFGDLLGRSLVMRNVFAQLSRVSHSVASVLILGESGTGKELAAEAIHAASPRSQGPFVVVDCGSLPATIIESELFGHVRGAFTGANESRAGAFEAAQGGTIFLDEIGELELSLQPRLLRALEARTVRRIGGDRNIQLDVRVLAATNRDLAAMVASGDFREDLYHRLNVVRVRLPPLREHREDIELLARHFAALAVQKYPQARADAVSDEVVAQLEKRSWPGNSRELRNVVERLVLLGPRARFEDRAGDSQSSGYLELPFQDARDVAVARFEKAYVEAALERHGGNVAAAARACGVHRGYLFRLIRRHEIKRS